MTPTFPEAFNLADYYLFERIREGRGARTAIRFGDAAFDYAEIADRSARAATVFRDAGLPRGGRALVVLRDLPAFAWTFFGVLAAGGVIAMGNPDAPIDDLAYLVRYVGASIVVTHPRVWEGLRPLVADTELQRAFLVVEAATGEDPRAPVSHPLSGATDLESAIRSLAPDGPRYRARTHRDEPAIFLFTSGSTGKPKAAMHAHRDFAFNTEVFAKGTMGLREDDVHVSVSRLFFGYATGTNLMFPFAVGASTGLFSERPTPESLLAAIERYRPTVITNVPTMMGKLLDEDDRRRAAGEPPVDLASVRFSYSAGEALPGPLLTRWRERFASEVYDGIGSAEMFHIYASNRPGDVMPGSLGRVVEGYTLKILPEDAEGAGATALPPGEIGVLWVKGDSVAHGYFQDRDKSWSTFHGHWCRTGDLFSIDADGYLYFQGRADDLFKVGGIFVAPREVEDCLLGHPAVSSVAVIPAEDQGLTKPKAVVVLRPESRAHDRTALAAELKAHVQSRLSKHKYPRWIVFVDDLPKNDRGKVDKKTLLDHEKRGQLVGE